MADMTTGFVSSEGGMELYWSSIGEGPALVCCNGVGVSTFFWKYIAAYFGQHHKVIVWDYPGHGRSSLPSDPDTADLSMERLARDLERVLEAAQVREPPVLLGHSMGCQVILEAHRTRPTSYAALVPMFGTFGRPLDTFYDFPWSRTGFDIIKRLARQSNRATLRMLLPLYASPLAFPFGQMTGLVDRYYAARKDIEHYIQHLGHMDPRVFVRMVELMADHDMEPHLPEIGLPTLIFGGENDAFTPLHRAHRMAELIPHAELMVLAEGSHAAIVEHPDTINQRVRRFLQERVPTHATAD
ncbi:MAG: alpha/beta fold hydrolase [Myxococcota bacterium]